MRTCLFNNIAEGGAIQQLQELVNREENEVDPGLEMEREYESDGEPMDDDEWAVEEEGGSVDNAAPAPRTIPRRARVCVHEKLEAKLNSIVDFRGSDFECAGALSFA